MGKVYYLTACRKVIIYGLLKAGGVSTHNVKWRLVPTHLVLK